MLRKLLYMTVLLGFILPPQAPKIQTTNPNTEHKLYLPLSVNTYPYIEAITLGYVSWSYTWLYSDCVWGYTIALTPSAVYSVTLGIDVISAYYPVYIDYFSPTLEATLPDQKNPFSYCIGSLAPNPLDLGDVKVVSTSLIPPNGRVNYPLTVTSWKKKTKESGVYIFGTIRNDSGHRLVDARVAGVIEDVCPYDTEAVLETTTLDPGEKADFNIMQCVEAVSEISAQGVAEP